MQNTTPKYPATQPQLALIATLQAERNLPVGVEPGLTKAGAKQMINALLALPKYKAPEAPQPSLVEMAAQITGTQVPEGYTQPVAAAPAKAIVKPTPAPHPSEVHFTETELRAIRGAFGVVDMEVGEFSPAEQAAYDKVTTYLQLVDAAAAPAPVLETAGVVQNGKATVTFVPEGRYAVKADAGHWTFYHVDHGKAGGKWEGFVFLSQQLGPNAEAVKNKATKDAILAKIAADVQGAMVRYGKELGVCGACGLELTNPQSIEDGIGPVCKGKLGF